MKITDEALSAFLDNELTAADMDEVRCQLMSDPALADRLAELAVVDTQLQAHYGTIDNRPLPAAITRMLEAEPGQREAAPDDTVIPFPGWRILRGHAAKAVAAVFIGGIALVQWLGLPSDNDPAWAAVANILDSQPGGISYRVGDNATLTPQLTFRNQSGDWCRQFRLNTENSASEQIACRDEGGAWAQVERVVVEAIETVPATERYRTAAGSNALDPALDRMMVGEAVGPEAERKLLEQRWSGPSSR